MQRANGAGAISTFERHGRTCLDTLYQEGCAKLRLPNTHDASLQAVLINTAGGLTGGDSMTWDARIASNGRAVLTTQACERIYRSLGGPAVVRTRLDVGPSAHLDWLPQETIMFAGSSLHRRLEVHLEAGASITAVEAFILGREAMGEAALDARLRDDWRIYRQERLIHAEATRLDGSATARENAALLAGGRAFATIVHVAADAEAAAHLLPELRKHMPPTGDIAASVIGERLVVRALAASGLALRRLIVPTLQQLNGAGSLPRLWHL
jgi:urease accessory protein